MLRLPGDSTRQPLPGASHLEARPTSIPAVGVRQQGRRERREQALRDRVVPTVARPTQAGSDPVAREHVGVRLRRVLAAPVSVIDDVRASVGTVSGHRSSL